ncbi:hypothetical protein pb186bvf_020835 [Paramecium bursaria]
MWTMNQNVVKHYFQNQHMIDLLTMEYCSFTDGKCVTTMPYLPCDFRALSRKSCIENTYGNCVFDTFQ